MSRAGLYVPKPYPDELFYSLAARFVRHLNMRSPKAALSLLYGNTSMIATVDLPGRFDSMRWLVEGRWERSIEDVVWEMTQLPFYVGFLSEVERENAVARLIYDKAIGIHTSLGICASWVHHHEFLHLCPTCVSQDVEKYGEPYWHRSHQLPGTLVCAQHGDCLVTTSVPFRPRGRHEFIAATSEHILTPIVSNGFSLTEVQILQDIAKRGEALLLSEMRGHREFSLIKLQTRLRTFGYDNKRGNVRRLNENFCSLFGERILQVLSGSAQNRFSLNWLDAIHRKPRHRLHPLRIILLEVFMDRVQRAKLPDTFGQGPWPCLNWHANHFGESVVTSMKRITTKNRDAEPVARFSCSCGFVYTRKASQDSNKYHQIVQFGPLFIRQANELYQAGYRVNAIARILGVYWKTAERFVLPPNDIAEKNPSESLTKDQNDWLKAITNSNGCGVTQIRKQNQALYFRLYHAQRDWLRAHSPHQDKQSVHKREQRVDWESRDIQVMNALVKEIENIKQIVPPVRVTANRLASNLGIRPLIHKKLKKLPQTEAFLRKACETLVEFRVRRLRYAMEQDPGAPRWKTLRIAGIRKEYITPEICIEAGFQMSDTRENNSRIEK